MSFSISDASQEDLISLIALLNTTVDQQNAVIVQQGETIVDLTNRQVSSANSEISNASQGWFGRSCREIGRYLPKGTTLTYTKDLFCVAGSVYAVAKIVFPQHTAFVCIGLGAAPFVFSGLSVLASKVSGVSVPLPRPLTPSRPQAAGDSAVPENGNVRDLNSGPALEEDSKYWKMTPELFKSSWKEISRYLPAEATLVYSAKFFATAGFVVEVAKFVFPDKYIVASVVIGVGYGLYLERDRLSCLASRTYRIFSGVRDHLLHTRPVYEERAVPGAEGVSPEGESPMDISTFVMPDGNSADRYVDDAIRKTIERVNSAKRGAPLWQGGLRGAASGVAVVACMAVSALSAPILTPLFIKAGAAWIAGFTVLGAVAEASDSEFIDLNRSIQYQAYLMSNNKVPENVIEAFKAKTITHIIQENTKYKFKDDIASL